MTRLFFFLLLLRSGDGHLREEYRKESDKIILEILGKGTLKESGNNPPREFYKFESANSVNGSFVIFSSAKGRTEYFDYLVIIDSTLQIKHIKILKYRSEYGYEITNKGWLKQFYDKPVRYFEHGKDIDAIAGATFSSRSLVKDLNEILSHLAK